MGVIEKITKKNFETSIKAHQKTIDLSLKAFNKTGDPKYLKKIQKAKNEIEKIKNKMNKHCE